MERRRDPAAEPGLSANAIARLEDEIQWPLPTVLSTLT
jgi:hypothetical protein